MRYLVSGLMLLIVTSKVRGFTEARLLNQSSSGQTVYFNVGTHDGVGEGDFAVVVKPIRNLEEKNLRLLPVAKAKNIKINTDSSVWILYYVYDAELLVKDQKFLIFSETNMLKGRREPEMRRLKVVSPEGDSAVRASQVVNDDQDRLAKKKYQYRTITPTRELDVKSDKDFELLDLEEWEKIKGERYRAALFKSPHREEFRRNYRLETFQKLVSAYLRKVNDPNFDYETFYEDQMRDDFYNDFRKKGSVYNEYENFLRDQSRKSTEDAKLYRTLLEKGDTWSEDFSDEELRVTLESVSVLQEKDRKKRVVSKPFRYSSFLDYGRHMKNSQTSQDNLYQRTQRYAMGLELEVTPFMKHEYLEHFTFSLEARSNRNAFATEGRNANLDEYSAALGINWYPLYAPYTVDSFVPYLGTYIRSGYAEATVVASNQQANYNLWTVPGFRGGVRYNFRNNFGLRIMGSMETSKLRQYDTNKLASDLPQELNLFEAKLGIALAYSF